MFVIGASYSALYLVFYTISVNSLPIASFGGKLLIFSVSSIFLMLLLIFVGLKCKSFFIGAIIGSLVGVMVFTVELLIYIILIFLPFLGDFLGTAAGNVFGVMVEHSVPTTMLLLTIYFGYVITNTKSIPIRAFCFAIGYNLFFSLVAFHATMWNFYFSVFLMPIVLYVPLAVFSGNGRLFRCVTVTFFGIFTMPVIYFLAGYFSNKYFLKGFDLLPYALMKFFLPLTVGVISIIDHIIALIISEHKKAPIKE